MWRLAGSLIQLRTEVNAVAPNRSKASDGAIGNAAHAASRSDHNPQQDGVVCALDVTHDPANGADCHAWAERVRTSGQPCLKYVIFAGRIASVTRGLEWRAYTGSNPHTSHMHVSVGRGGDGRSTEPYDDETSWGIAAAPVTGTPQVQPPPAETTMAAPPFPLPQGWYFGPRSGPRESVSGFYGHGDDLAAWQQQMQSRGWRITVDGRYGDETARVARLFQAEKGLVPDSLIGEQTWLAAFTAPIT
jgi:peptidoglycan hydrolase-like protein with peptidoglycan-binding domain